MFGMMVITNAGAAEEGWIKLRGLTEITLDSIEGRGIMSVDFHKYPTYEEEYQ